MNHRHAPLIGQHNYHVLCELLGLLPKEAERLVEEGVHTLACFKAPYDDSKVFQFFKSSYVVPVKTGIQRVKVWIPAQGRNDGMVWVRYLLTHQ